MSTIRTDPLEAVGRVTQRERHLLRLLWEMRTFTTTQIAEMYFSRSGLVTARHRLSLLAKIGVLDRFRPFRAGGGSAETHWLLGPTGAAIAAAELGQPTPTARSLRSSALTLAASPRLGHLLAINGFFSSLVAAARYDRAATLEQWWTERKCAMAWGRLVRPDAAGRWRDDAGCVDFSLEVDMGTESHRRLAGKLAGYQDLRGAGEAERWVLFWFPTVRRETSARHALAGTDLLIATASAQLGSPSSAIWLPVGNSYGRATLGGLRQVGEVTGRGAIRS